MNHLDPTTEAAAYLNLLRMQPLGDMVESHFGPRCAEYDENCACCRAWRWLDVVNIVIRPEMTATPNRERMSNFDVRDLRAKCDALRNDVLFEQDRIAAFLEEREKFRAVLREVRPLIHHEDCEALLGILRRVDALLPPRTPETVEVANP